MSGIILKDKELDRLLLIKQIQDRKISQVEASDLLGISTPQVRRLLRRVKEVGSEGIKGRQAGGNRSFKAEFKKQVIQRVSDQYADFGPLLPVRSLSFPTI